MSKKFQFVMTDGVADLLDELKNRTGRENASEVIRDALRAYAWIVGEYDQGRTVLSQQARESGAVPFSPVVPITRVAKEARR